MSAVVAVLLVDFHHKLGPRVEFSQPADFALPPEWAHLPFLALPDGVHRRDIDATYFVLAPTAAYLEPLYCVACIRQIATTALLAADEAVTRNTVLKSVVVLSRLPLFGLLYDHLATTTAVLFAQKDFSGKQILQELHASLTHRVAALKVVDDSYLFGGCNLRALVLGLRHGLLHLFKSILLQRRVLVHAADGAASSHEVCAAVLAIASLLPGLWATRCDGRAPRLPAAMQAQTEPAARLASVGGPLPALDLAVRPLVALQELDSLLSSTCYLVGTTNQMMTEHPGLADMIVNISPPGIVHRNSHVRSLLDLTTPDLRFIDSIIQTVLQTAPDDSEPTVELDSWLGSSAWIRHQFADYTVALLATADHARMLNPPLDADAMQDFGTAWTAAWQSTSAYRAWLARAATMSVRPSHTVPPNHLHHGALRLGDVGLYMNRLLGNSKKKDEPRAEPAASALQGAYTSLRSGWSSFWRQRAERKEMEKEQERAGQAPQLTTSEDDDEGGSGSDGDGARPTITSDAAALGLPHESPALIEHHEVLDVSASSSAGADLSKSVRPASRPHALPAATPSAASPFADKQADASGPAPSHASNSAAGSMTAAAVTSALEIPIAADHMPLTAALAPAPAPATAPATAPSTATDFNPAPVPAGPVPAHAPATTVTAAAAAVVEEGKEESDGDELMFSVVEPPAPR